MMPQINMAFDACPLGYDIPPACNRSKPTRGLVRPRAYLKEPTTTFSDRNAMIPKLMGRYVLNLFAIYKATIRSAIPETLRRPKSSVHLLVLER